MTRHTVSCALAVLALTTIPARGAAAADATLVEAQRLYEGASYEQALALLDSLEGTDSRPTEDTRAIRQYRALCLIALDRPRDAERPIEEMVRADPTATPGHDLTPRLRLLYEQVRRRVAASVVREAYDRGRALFARGEKATAAREFRTMLALFNDPALSLSTDTALADLRLVADGFLALTAEPVPRADASAPPAVQPRPAPPEPTTAAAPRAESTPATAPPVSPTPPAVAQERAAPAVSAALIPPRPLAQPVPPFRQAIAGYANRREGELELQIGIDGRVTAARITVPTVPSYDALLVSAARSDWRYQPATRGGVAVPYTIRIKFVLQDR